MTTRCSSTFPTGGIAFEATGDYRRPLAYFPQAHGFSLCLVSSIAVARTRDALYNSWDKNDPKDVQVILHLLKAGTTQVYHDPLENHYNDLEEMANTYQQISLWKVRVYHSIVTHFLPLYFPEADSYLHSSRAEWGTQLLLLVPCPAAVAKYPLEKFLAAVRRLPAQKIDKTRWLTDSYRAAQYSIGLPVAEDSEANRMFRVVLNEYLHLRRSRRQFEEQVVGRLSGHGDFRRLQTIPSIGPILALIILAEACDLRHFGHNQKFLKYCGLNLSTKRSGLFRGTTGSPSATMPTSATPSGWRER